MQTIRITTSQNIDIDYEVAGLGERILARLIDLAILAALYLGGMILVAIFSAGSGGYDTAFLVMAIILMAIITIYDLLFEIFMNGQSIGKRIMKIKVISLNGSQPSVGQYLLRWLFRIVDFLLVEPGLVALIVAAVSSKPQRLGDIVAGTMLIRTAPRTKMDNIVFMPAYAGYQAVFPEAANLSARDIELIHEVIANYTKTNNSSIVYTMAQRVKQHLNIEPPQEMNSMVFLQTIMKDYTHLSAQADVL
jgi:uncharacterized RDD family membrane protein YckC